MENNPARPPEAFDSDAFDIVGETLAQPGAEHSPGQETNNEPEALEISWQERRRLQVEGLKEHLGRLESGSAETQLREHQSSVFKDLVEFLDNDGDAGYIKLPTGTGKTAIFVELCKTMLADDIAPQARPKILILVPTKDLVDQTIGDQRKRGGFTRFAPEVDVRPLFGDTTQKKRRVNIGADVIVSTYATFNTLMRERDEYVGHTDEDWEKIRENYRTKRHEVDQEIEEVREQIRQAEAGLKVNPDLLLERQYNNISRAVFRKEKEGKDPSRAKAKLAKFKREHPDVEERVMQIRLERARIEGRRERIKADLLPFRTHIGHAIEGTITLQNRIAELDRIDYVICDEAHRALGQNTLKHVRQFYDSGRRTLIGLTATDRYHSKSLATHFGELIHEVTIPEAIRLKLLNNLALYVHNTGLDYHDVRENSVGEFDEALYSELSNSFPRNEQAVDFAAMFIEAGISGVTTAIPGKNTIHAKNLARQMKQRYITDPVTGAKRPIRAAYVTGDLPLKARNAITRAFEQGKIDWMVFVDVLREGWDSDRAKALINLRPTRSELLATQRAGRILRSSPTQPFSYIIDFQDRYEIPEEGTLFETLPPVLAVDVMGLPASPQGTVLGETDLVPDQELHKRILSITGNQTMEPRFTSYSNLASESPKVIGPGRLIEINGPERQDWWTFEHLRDSLEGFMPFRVLKHLEGLAADGVRSKSAAAGRNMVEVFNLNDLRKFQSSGPVINPSKLYIDAQGLQWISPEGCRKLVRKIFPLIHPDTVRQIIEEAEADQGKLEWQIARVRIFYGSSEPHYGFTELYKLNDIIDKVVPYVRQYAERS